MAIVALDYVSLDSMQGSMEVLCLQYKGFGRGDDIF